MKSWHLVGEVGKGLSRWWMILGGFLFLFFFFQTIFGQYKGIEGIAWGWLLVNVLPCLGLIFAGLWLHQYPAKLIPSSIKKGLRALHISYLFLLLGTIFFSQAAVNQLDISLSSYLFTSFLWLLPFNAMVTAGTGLLFFRKKGWEEPATQNIRETAILESQKASAKEQLTRKSCMELVAEGKLVESLDLLIRYFEQHGPDSRLNHTSLLKGQLTNLQKDLDINIIDPEEAQRAQNRVAMAVLNMAESL